MIGRQFQFHQHALVFSGVTVINDSFFFFFFFFFFLAAATGLSESVHRGNLTHLPSHGTDHGRTDGLGLGSVTDGARPPPTATEIESELGRASERAEEHSCD